MKRNMICPRCNRIMFYDPYFRANVCRQCGAMEQVSIIEITSKKIIAPKCIIAKRKLVNSAQ